MFNLRSSRDRGHGQFRWLEARHSFSFADYYDPNHVHWGPLRVLNEDRIAGGGGFPAHPLRDMEIITWVLEGQLTHQDSTGGRETITPGEIQRMSAGTGITHSEFNASASEPVHLLQIWLLPGRPGIKPGYEQKRMMIRPDGLTLLAAPDARDGAVNIHQDADIWVARLNPGDQTQLRPKARGRLQWLQVAKGELSLNGQRLEQGDGAAIAQEDVLTLKGLAPAEALIFDMAPLPL